MSTPLYEQLYQYVNDAILSGKLKAGDRVPSEKELAEQFQVSRITSKKALEMLHHAGLIERIQGRGSFVAPSAELHGRARTAAPAPPVPKPRSALPFIGVIVPDFADAYALKMIHALEETAADASLFLVVKRTYGSQAVEKEAIQSLVVHGIQGLIVFPVHGEYYNPELLRLVLEGFPVVLVDRRLQGISSMSVSTDNIRASQQLTRHLLDKGHRHIAFIAPPAKNTSTIEERIEGYRLALRSVQLDENDYLLTSLYSTLPTAFDEANIRRDSETLRAFIQAKPHLTAFVACEFNLALLLRDVLSQLQLDHEIVCFDSPDLPLAPPLFTHIKQDETLMGRRAMELLLDAINGDTTPRSVIVPFTFVEYAQTLSS